MQWKIYSNDMRIPERYMLVFFQISQQKLIFWNWNVQYWSKNIFLKPRFLARLLPKWLNWAMDIWGVYSATASHGCFPTHLSLSLPPTSGVAADSVLRAPWVGLESQGEPRHRRRHLIPECLETERGCQNAKLIYGDILALLFQHSLTVRFSSTLPAIVSFMGRSAQIFI